jgi:hypothetical protein
MPQRRPPARIYYDIANLDLLDRHGRSGYLLRPPPHAQCRHRHLGAEVGSSPWPFWPACSRWGVALAHARLGPGRWASSGRHQFRGHAWPRKPHANFSQKPDLFEPGMRVHRHLGVERSTPTTLGATVVHIQGLVAGGNSAEEVERKEAIRDHVLALRAAARGGALGGRSGRIFGGLSGENTVRGRIGIVRALSFDSLPKILDNRPRAPIVCRSNSFMFFFGALAGFNTNAIFFACIRTHGAISST